MTTPVAEPLAAPAARAATAAALDPRTIYAIAAICYFAAMATHEALGHAGTTLLLGGQVIQINSASCNCDTSAISPWAARAVFADGCVANIITGLLALWLARFLRSDRALARYAAWIFGHISIFIATGYMMVFPFLPAGDWHDFVQGLPAPIAWRLGLTIAGVVSYYATMRHAQRALSEFLGADPLERRRRARTLTLGPYLVGSIIETLSSIAGGATMLTLISAIPATFGGTIGLPFTGSWAASAGATKREQSRAIALPRSRAVIAIGVIVVLIQLFWFGPGLLRSRRG